MRRSTVGTGACRDVRGGALGALVFTGAFILAFALGAVGATSAAAQEFPNIGGFDLRVGGNSPTQESAGVSASLDADLGYIESPFFRAIVGFSYFRGGVQRTGMSDGSFNAAGLRGGVRGDFYQLGTVRPYALAALTGHNVSAEVPDVGLEQLLEGFYVGATVALGAMVALDSPSHFGVVTEVRRLFANNIGGWAFEIGFRWTPRGPDMYRTRDEIERERRERDLSDREAVDARARDRRDIREEETRQAQRDRVLREALRDLDWDVRSMQSVRDTERGIVVVLGPGLFERESHMLSDQGRRDLSRIAQTIRQQREREVRVEVQTDSRQWAEERLAERRADSVRSVLVSEGIDPDRVTAVGQEVDREERVQIIIRTRPGQR